MEVVNCRRHTAVLYFVVILCWFPSTVQPKCNDTENLQEWIDRTNNLQEWIERTEVIVIDLTINITDIKAFCNSTRSCYGNNSAVDKTMGHQLKPLIVQNNTKIRFNTDNDFNGHHLTVYQVDEINFLDCNTSDGKRLRHDNHTELRILNEDVSLSSSRFFIVDSLELCKNGVRIHLVVTSHNCSSTDNDTSISLCSGHGICAYRKYQEPEAFTCHCCDDYSGNNCEIENRSNANVVPEDNLEAEIITVGSTTVAIDLCSLYPCLNNGTCVVIGINSSICVCAEGYTDSSCGSRDNCLPNPCVNGICVQKNNAIQCYCHSGYYGHYCEKEYNECTSRPCQHGGHCEDLIDGFRCHCTHGYTGTRCTRKVNMCSPMPCKNGSVCIDSGDRFICACKAGYTGTYCEVNINECESEPCLHGGTCHDLVNGFRCHCAETHAGFRCEFSLDVFAPPIDSEMPDGKSHVNNLYIVAGTLLGALIIVLSVVAGCYCKIHETYKHFRWRRLRYHITKTPSESSLEVSSVNTPRLSIDAIWEATALTKDTGYRNTSYSDTLQTKVI